MKKMKAKTKYIQNEYIMTIKRTPNVLGIADELVEYDNEYKKVLSNFKSSVLSR